jgi:hypothetical protein
MDRQRDTRANGTSKHASHCDGEDNPSRRHVLQFCARGNSARLRRAFAAREWSVPAAENGSSEGEVQPEGVVELVHEIRRNRPHLVLDPLDVDGAHLLGLCLGVGGQTGGARG